MRVKYFTAPSREEAESQAEAFFGASVSALHLEVEREGSNVRPWLLLVFDAAPPENLTGSYQIRYEPEGVFLELVAPRGTGYPVDRNDLLVAIKRKNPSGLMGQEVGALLEHGSGRVQIAPPQQEVLLGEEPLVQVSKDEMEATLTILPPDPGGAELNLEGMRSALAQAGVVFGIQEEALAALAAKKAYNQPIVVALGTPPVDGADGELITHFDSNEDQGRPNEDESGRVNYRDLNLFVPVTEGQLLITRTPAEEGTPGQTVTGKPIRQREGREARLPKSKNTVTNEDQTAIYAKTSGMVETIGGVVQVLNIYTVKQDVDMGIGNIEFDGNVQIVGNVIAGMTIKATGSIVIGGVVEGSELVAGGNIELKRGMQGMDRGKVIAGGDVRAMFIERATVSAGGDLVADTVIHSNISAGNAIILQGKRANIVGGTALAGKEIVAKVVGAESATRTELEVGFSPFKRARIETLELDQARIAEELEKLSKLDGFLAKAAAAGDEEKAKLHASVIESIRQNKLTVEEQAEELNGLKEAQRQAVNGKVHVLGSIHPGCRISIGSGIYRIEQEIPYSTFKFREGEVVFGPCEYSG